MIEIKTMTPLQIQQVGLSVLLRELGPVGLIRFMEQYEPGTGDYTEDHHKWLDSLLMDDVIGLALEEQEEEK